MWVIYNPDKIYSYFYSMKACKAQFGVLGQKIRTPPIAYARFRDIKPKLETMQILQRKDI